MYKYSFILYLLFTLVLTPAMAQKIKIVTEHLPPFQIERTEDGSVHGVSVEIVTAVADKVGIPYSISCFPWARSYKLALTHPNVLIFSIGRNQEREKQFKWIGTITNIKSYFYKLVSRKDIQINSYADAKKYITGVPRDDMRYQTLISKGFAQTRL